MKMNFEYSEGIEKDMFLGEGTEIYLIDDFGGQCIEDCNPNEAVYYFLQWMTQKRALNIRREKAWDAERLIKDRRGNIRLV